MHAVSLESALASSCVLIRGDDWFGLLHYSRSSLDGNQVLIEYFSTQLRNDPLLCDELGENTRSVAEVELGYGSWRIGWSGGA